MRCAVITATGLTGVIDATPQTEGIGETVGAEVEVEDGVAPVGMMMSSPEGLQTRGGQGVIVVITEEMNIEKSSGLSSVFSPTFSFPLIK